VTETADAAIQSEDELPHRPSSDSTWRENWWLCFFDHRSGLHGVAYTGVQPGLGTGFAMFAVFQGGQALTILDESDIPTNQETGSANGAGPIRFACAEPMQRWTVAVRSRTIEADLVFTALHQAYDWDWDGATKSRHYEQAGRVAGSIVLDGRRLEIEGFGQRDRAWGVREPSILRQAWSSRVLFSEEDFGHASAITVGARTFLFGYRVTTGRATLIDRLQLDVSYAYPGGPPVSTELLAWGAEAALADQQVRLVNVIPHSSIVRGQETRQFFTFSNFVEGGRRAAGQLDYWWSDRTAIGDHFDVAGNQGRWVQ
jgi:hypothetical protein